MLKEITAEYGISAAHACAIRLGKARNAA
jgi:hypothetical protein